jgi:hypothetical protein
MLTEVMEVKQFKEISAFFGTHDLLYWDMVKSVKNTFP